MQWNSVEASTNIARSATRAVFEETLNRYPCSPDFLNFSIVHNAPYIRLSTEFQMHHDCDKNSVPVLLQNQMETTCTPTHTMAILVCELETL